MSSTENGAAAVFVLPGTVEDACPQCGTPEAVWRCLYGLVVPPADMDHHDYVESLARDRIYVAGCCSRPDLAYVCRTCWGGFDEAGAIIRPGRDVHASPPADPTAAPAAHVPQAGHAVRRVVTRRSTRSRRRG